MKSFSVLVSGAGLGGLCLAHSLRRAGIGVQVFERDASPWERPQGYRLHIDSDGASALADALPPELYDLFERTSMKPHPFTTIVDTAFREVRRQANESPSHSGVHLNVDRATLRQILLRELDDVLVFGESLTHYSSDESGVTACFASGRVARGDVLVGADGIRSAVRMQRLPHAQIQDTGVRAIYGRIAMADAARLLPDQALRDVFTVAVDERALFLGVGPVAFPQRPADLGLVECDDYVVCIVGGRRERFGRDDATLRDARSGELKGLAESLVAAWDPRAAEIPALGDPSSFFFVEMFTSVPLVLRAPTNVTLLGDAIHAMTPTLGRGANLALRDGARLGRWLARVAGGDIGLPAALGEYEAEMAGYAFDVVRQSAAMGMRLMGQDPLPEE